MAILSKIKSAAKNYAKNVVGGAKIVASAVNKAATTGAKSQLSNVLSSRSSSPKVSAPVSLSSLASSSGLSFDSRTPAPSGYSYAPTLKGGSTLVPSSSSAAALQSAAGRSTSSPIYSAPTTLSAGYSPTSSGSPTFKTPSTISSAALYPSFTQSFSSLGSSGSASGTTTSAPSISLPAAPTYSDPGPINNGGLVGVLTDVATYDAGNNSFAMIPPPEETAQDRALAEEKAHFDSWKNFTESFLPKRASVLDDPAIRKQQREIQKRKEEVATYTAQLNNIVAQQNVDLLRTRGVGSTEGVTETVYGGQAATINREAAIKALPVQAQVAAAQGNLELAQDYLTQLTTWKTEQIDNDYKFQMAMFNSLDGFLKGQEKNKAEEKKEQRTRAWELAMYNLQEQDAWAKEAAKTNPALISKINSLDSNSPTFRSELGRITSQIRPKTSSEIPTVKSINGVDMQWNPVASKWEPINSGTVSSQARTEALSQLSLVNELLSSPELENVTGINRLNPFNYIPGTNVQYAKNQFNQVKSNLSLENRQKLKGSGAISDFEFKVLGQAATSLGNNLADKDAQRELKKIRGVFETAAGLPSLVKITDPTTGKSVVVRATRENINQALADGAQVDYQ